MLKTSSVTKKRFKVSSNGKLLHRKATRGHKLSGKAASRKRAFTQDHTINSNKVVKTIKTLIGV